MHKLLKFSWTRALGSAALLAVAAVVFVVLILPAAAFGSKRAKKVTCATPPSNFDFSPTKGRPYKEVILTGEHMDHVNDVFFRDAQGGLIEAADSTDVISSTMIRTHVPSGAVSGKIAVDVATVGGSSECGPLVYSRRSFNVK